MFEKDLEARKQQIIKHKNIESTIAKVSELAEFLYHLSDLISWNGHIFTLFKDGRKFLMQTELLDSAVKTLCSIKNLIEVGHFSDVNVLIRKLRDDLFLYLYLVEVVNRYSIINKSSKHERNALNWMEDKLDNLYISDILVFLIQNNKINEVILKYELRDSWEKINDNLNRFVHANGRVYAHLNYSFFKDIDVAKIAKDTLYKLNYVIAVFMVLLILTRPSLTSSSDNMDALAVGIPPIEGSQYDVAPFIQSFIDKFIVEVHPDLKNFLKDSVYMNIE